MAEITRSSILQSIADQLAIQQGVNATPRQLGTVISPTFEVGPKYATIVRNGSSVVTGTLSLYTTPLDKDFFITSITHLVKKDVTCDTATGEISTIGVAVGGVNRKLSQFNSITLTADTYLYQQTFPYPIKVDRGAGINLTGAFGAGVMVKAATITGFILE